MFLRRFVLSLWAAVPSIFLAQAALAQSGGCSLNGQSVPCDQMFQQAGPFLYFLIALWACAWVVGLLFFIFWIKMLIHAAQNPIEDKTVWVLIIIFLNLIGAIIYYFSVKKKWDKEHPSVKKAAPTPTPPAQT